MAKQEISKQGCFSSFFKVLLCARNETSPPVYPSEKVEEEKYDFFDDSNSITTPSVVARLMGLDSLPKTKRVVRETTLDCVPRSKSVNFVDYLLEFDQSIGNHRRVKTSSSFREVPSQKNYLFVLDIDDKKGNKVQEENVTKLKKKNKEIVRVKKEKNKRVYKIKDEPRKVPSSRYKSKVRDCRKGEVFSSVSPRCNCGYYGYGDVGSSSSSSSVSPLPKSRIKKGFVEPKMRNKVSKNHVSTKKIQTEHSLENLSPISVLDVNDYAFLYGADYSGTNTLASKSKRKSKSLLEVSLDEDVEEKANNNKGYASHTDINREAELYSDLMLKIRSLTEESINKSDSTYKAESFEEICFVFEETIFDTLLFEVLNELV
ncbi:hypothetical protein RYX36_011862 [Vicia faba]